MMDRTRSLILVRPIGPFPLWLGMEWNGMEWTMQVPDASTTMWTWTWHDMDRALPFAPCSLHTVHSLVLSMRLAWTNNDSHSLGSLVDRLCAHKTRRWTTHEWHTGSSSDCFLSIFTFKMSRQESLELELERAEWHPCCLSVFDMSHCLAAHDMHSMLQRTKSVRELECVRTRNRKRLSWDKTGFQWVAGHWQHGGWMARNETHSRGCFDVKHRWTRVCLMLLTHWCTFYFFHSCSFTLCIRNEKKERRTGWNEMKWNEMDGQGEKTR